MITSSPLDIFITDDNHPDIRFDAGPLIAKLPEHELASIGPKRMKLMRENGIKLHHADKMAVRLGYHPYEIWGDDFYKIEPNQKLVEAAFEILKFLKNDGSSVLNSIVKNRSFKSKEINLRRALLILVRNGYVSKNYGSPVSYVYFSFIKDLEPSCESTN
jgi:hypothetical protein